MLIKGATKVIEECGFTYSHKLEYSSHNYYLFSEHNILVVIEEALSFALDGNVNQICFYGSTHYSEHLFHFMANSKLSGAMPFQGSKVYSMSVRFHPMHGLDVLEKILHGIVQFNFTPPPAEGFDVWIQPELASCKVKVQTNEIEELLSE